MTRAVDTRSPVVEAGVWLEGHGDDAKEALDFIRWALAFGLVCTAGLASGLTLAFFSLDLLELEVLRRAGSQRERGMASRVLPFLMSRSQHQLLVALLMVNSLANEALPLVLDPLLNPLAAVLISVTGVLIFGEILPQALCARHALAISQACTGLATVLMALTAPVSWPLAKLLDWLLDIAAEEPSNTKGRDEGTYQPPVLTGPPSGLPDSLALTRPLPPSLWGAKQAEWEGQACEQEGALVQNRDAAQAQVEQDTDTWHAVQVHVQHQLQQVHTLQGKGERGQLQPHIQQYIQQHQQSEREQERLRQEQQREVAVARLARALSGGMGPNAQVQPDMLELADAAVSGSRDQPSCSAMAEVLMDHKKLKALISLHGRAEGLGGQLAEDEVKVMLGALDLRFKSAHMAMTPLHRVLMLSASTPLSYDTLRLLLARGHSRVPVVRATLPRPDSPPLPTPTVAVSPAAVSQAPAKPAHAAPAPLHCTSPEAAELDSPVLHAPHASPAAGGRATPISALCNPDAGQRSLPLNLRGLDGLKPEHVLGVLLVKELIMVDFESGQLSVEDVPLRQLPTIPCDTSLLDMMQLFQKGGTHMALLIQRRSQAAKAGLQPTTCTPKCHTAPAFSKTAFPHAIAPFPAGPPAKPPFPIPHSKCSSSSVTPSPLPIHHALSLKPPLLGSLPQHAEPSPKHSVKISDVSQQSSFRQGQAVRGQEPGSKQALQAACSKQDVVTSGAFSLGTKQDLQAAGAGGQTGVTGESRRDEEKGLVFHHEGQLVGVEGVEREGQQGGISVELDSSFAGFTDHASMATMASNMEATASDEPSTPANLLPASLPDLWGPKQKRTPPQGYQAINRLGGPVPAAQGSFPVPPGISGPGARTTSFRMDGGSQGNFADLVHKADAHSDQLSQFRSMHSDYKVRGRQDDDEGADVSSNGQVTQSGLLEALIAHDRAAALATGPYGPGSDTPARTVVSAHSAHTLRTMPCGSIAQTSPDSSPGVSSLSSHAASFCSERPYSPPSPHAFFRQSRQYHHMRGRATPPPFSHVEPVQVGAAHSASQPNSVASGVVDVLEVAHTHRHPHHRQGTAAGATTSVRGAAQAEVQAIEDNGAAFSSKERVPGFSASQQQGPETTQQCNWLSGSRTGHHGPDGQAGADSVCINMDRGEQTREEEDLQKGERLPEGRGKPGDEDDWLVVGIITLEDVIEEMMQVEIIDETDEWLDNTQNVRVSTLRLLASLPPAQRVRAARVRRTPTQLPR